MTNYFNLTGLFLSSIGTFLLAIYGLPNLKVLSSGGYSEIDETPSIKKYQLRTKIGVWLLLAGFICQLVAQLLTICNS